MPRGKIGEPCEGRLGSEWALRGTEWVAVAEGERYLLKISFKFIQLAISFS